MMGVGLYIEECLQEIVGRFHASIRAEHGVEEPALRLAAPILLRDLARALRAAAPTREPWGRAMLLVTSQPPGGVRGLLREFALLRSCLWEAIAAHGHAVPPAERRQVDRYVDEAAAAAADRWATYVRLIVPTAMRQAPALAEAARPAAVPPPLPPPEEAGPLTGRGARRRAGRL